MKHDRASRSTVLSFVRQARSRSLNEFGALKKPKAMLLRTSQRYRPVRILSRPTPTNQRKLVTQHLAQVQMAFAQIAGEKLDLRTNGCNWLLLCAWDNLWLSLADPDIQLSAISIISMHAQLRQIFTLMRSSDSLSEDGYTLMREALDAIVESRVYKQRSEYGSESLVFSLVPEDLATNNSMSFH